jgi:hypothetical protein
MRAKDKHRANILEYLGNPDNDIPSRTVLAAIIGISRDTLYKTFTIDEMYEMDNEALAIRRGRYGSKLAEIDHALIERARCGDPQAIKLAFQRYEAWSEKSSHELSGPNGGPIETDFTVEFIKNKKVKK